MTVRRLHDDEVNQVASMLARAFVGDPFPALLADDPSTRLEASRWAFMVFARYGMAFGEVWAIGDLDGVGDQQKCRETITNSAEPGRQPRF